MLEDKNLTCRQCGREFVFTKGEQEFYQRKGLTLPNRCPECRQTKRIRPQSLSCSQCGTELDKDASICCTACLATVHLQSELDTRQSQNAVDEVQSELRESESEKANLAEALRQKERVIIQLKDDTDKLSRDLMEANEARSKLQVAESREAELAQSLGQKGKLVVELESRVRSISQELEKVRQFHADLQWIHPMASAIEERLETLEHGQNITNRRMLQLAERIHELHENTGLLRIIRSGIRRFLTQSSVSK